MARSATRPTGRFWALLALGAGVATAGIVVGLVLATRVRHTCGHNIYDLLQLYCTHTTHPHRTLGLSIVVVSLVLGSTLEFVAVRQLRRGRNPPRR